MPRRSAVVEHIVQRIDENLLTDLKQHPTQVRRWQVDNIFRRGLAYLVGWTGIQALMLRCTSTGILKVASTGAGLESYERNPSSNVDGWVTISAATVNTETFKEAMNSITIWTKDYELYIEVQRTDGTWLPKILLRGDLNEVFSQDMVANAVRFSNVVTDGTANASYQVVGFK